MKAKKIIFLTINIIGGVAVLGSYFLVVKAEGSGANALWGGIPMNVRPLYVVSMVLSALGFFFFLFFILFKLPPEKDLFGRFGYGLLYAIFLVILIPSAFWMPLSNVYVANPNPVMWAAVLFVLALVGLGSISLAWSLLSLKKKFRGAAYWLAVGGSIYFAFHTAVLDAIIWPALFR